MVHVTSKVRLYRHCHFHLGEGHTLFLTPFWTICSGGKPAIVCEQPITEASCQSHVTDLQSPSFNPAKTSDDCSPSQQHGFLLRRILQRGPPSYTIPGFLTPRNWVRLHICCFKWLSLGEIWEWFLTQKEIMHTLCQMPLSYPIW